MKDETETINGLPKILISKKLIKIAETAKSFVEENRITRDKASADIRYVESQIKEMGITFSFFYALYNTRVDDPTIYIAGEEEAENIELSHYESAYIDHYIVWDKAKKRLRYSSYKFIDLQDIEVDDEGNYLRVPIKDGRGVNCTCRSNLLGDTKAGIRIDMAKYLPEFLEKLIYHLKSKTDKEHVYEKSPAYGKDYPREIYFLKEVK